MYTELLWLMCIIVSTGTLEEHARTHTGTPHLDRRLEWQLYFTEHYNSVVTEHCVQLACHNDVC